MFYFVDRLLDIATLLLHGFLFFFVIVKANLLWKQIFPWTFDIIMDLIVLFSFTFFYFHLPFNLINFRFLEHAFILRICVFLLYYESTGFSLLLFLEIICSISLDLRIWKPGGCTVLNRLGSGKIVFFRLFMFLFDMIYPLIREILTKIIIGIR